MLRHNQGSHWDGDLCKTDGNYLRETGAGSETRNSAEIKSGRKDIAKGIMMYSTIFNNEYVVGDMGQKRGKWTLKDVLLVIRSRCGSVCGARMVSNLEIVEQNKQAKKIARTAPDALHSKNKKSTKLEGSRGSLCMTGERGKQVTHRASGIRIREYTRGSVQVRKDGGKSRSWASASEAWTTETERDGDSDGGAKRNVRKTAKPKVMRWMHGRCVRRRGARASSEKDSCVSLWQLQFPGWGCKAAKVFVAAILDDLHHLSYIPTEPAPSLPNKTGVGTEGREAHGFPSSRVPVSVSLQERNSGGDGKTGLTAASRRPCTPSPFPSQSAKTQVSWRARTVRESSSRASAERLSGPAPSPPLHNSFQHTRRVQPTKMSRTAVHRRMRISRDAL
ncbi:hypothetical protein GGX14DRAFT_397829 [Mycena pura]|uniref:Uncharacterized protein n=1 Tax=Mycena pura TaxID=153505 RepID=A0AAD6V7N9_9AGAR|nr:hypothetical protein GGX14DRAFT_397829 [Mycena pura]